MTDITAYESLGDLEVNRSEARPNILVAGSAVVSAVFFFGYAALTGLYASERASVIADGSSWLPNGVNLPLTQPNYMGLSMFFAFVTVWWAVASVKNSDRSNAIIAQVLTLLFAFGFVVQSFYLFTLLEMPASESEQAVLIYALAGTHLIALIAGMFGIIATLLRTIVGDFVDGKHEALVALAIYWTTVALAYSVLWYTVYITK